MKSINRTLYNYGLDIKDDLEVSPFEYIDTFRIRDYFEEIRSKLSEFEKRELKELDLILLSRASEFNVYLGSIGCCRDEDIPIERWWWHLDKITTGAIRVDIENNHVYYSKDKKI